MAKIKAEDVVKLQNSIKAKYPNIAVGVVELKEKNTIGLEVRVSSIDEMKKIPKEFEGYVVNTSVVSEKRLKQLQGMTKDRG
jgi:hypothetical protein